MGIQKDIVWSVGKPTVNTTKMVEDKISPEGLFTTVLATDPKPGVGGETVEQYRFRTQTQGGDPIKSPMEMFPLHIPNDLKLVFDRIEEFYEEGLTVEESKVLNN